MKSEEYIEGVLRTESGRFDAHHLDPRFLYAVLDLFVQAGKALDAMKRGLYYGKYVDYQKLDKAMSAASSAVSHFMASRVARRGSIGYHDDGDTKLFTPLPGFPSDHKSQTCPMSARLIHAAFGLGTESAEVMEKVLESLHENKAFDYTNLYEELGDLNWYQALALDTAAKEDPEAACDDDNAACGHGDPRDWSFEAIWEKNLAKLKTRYPEKFSTEKAFERDIAKEQAALEGK